MDISIIVISYNQESFISRCLNSIINQKFNGTIELIIGDDFSKDSTATIIKNLIVNIPFQVHFEKRTINLGPTANLVDLIYRAEGKYVCILEGDDFWSSTNKLEFQYNFLELNSRFSACTHKYSIIDENENILNETYSGKGAPIEEIYTVKHFENYIYPGHLGTLMFRNNLSPHSLESIKKLHHYIADISLIAFLVFQNPIYIINKNFACVRLVSAKTGSNYKSKIKGKSQNSHRIKYLQSLKEKIEFEFDVIVKFKKRAFAYFFWSVLFILRYPSTRNLFDLYHCTQYLLTGRIIDWKYEK